MPEATVTITGNLTADPELRFTQSGVAVANLTIASTPRVYDKNAQEWKDGEALFLRATVWKDAAENVADGLAKGQRVIATGKLKQRSWEDSKTGDKRTSVELEVDEIGPSLRFSQQRASRPAPSSSDPWGSDESPF